MSMSDEDRDVDVESDDCDDIDLRQGTRPSSGNQYYSQAEKRAHHNALERKRRDHIKDSFSSLRDSVPALNGEKASRAQILKKAAEYILFMKKKNNSHQQDIEDLRRQNNLLEAQSIMKTTKAWGLQLSVSVRTLERGKHTGQMNDDEPRDDIFTETDSEDVLSEMDDEMEPHRRRRTKKLKLCR